MLKNLLTIVLFGCIAVHAQNCTTQPSINKTAIASGNSIIGNSANNTITVNLAPPGWTAGSGTGYATIYGTQSYSYGGSYKILSGNGTGPHGSVGATQIVLDQTSRVNGAAAANGSTSGTVVSDVAVVPDPNSVRKFTISWTTPGFNSTTNLSYGDDADTTTLQAYGYNWVHQDTVTGVQMHSVTIDNLDLTLTDNVGQYFFGVWSECFTNGQPDKSLRVMLSQNSLAPNAGGNAAWNHKIQVSTLAGYTASLDTWTLQGYSGASTAYVNAPQRDGIHPGFQAAPGGIIDVGLYMFDTTIPANSMTPLGNNGANVTVTDWNGKGTGLLSLDPTGVGSGTIAGVAWSGGTIVINNASGGAMLILNIPASAPTTGTGCTNLGGDLITLDDGITPACAYPLRISGMRYISGTGYTCGTAITCGPPGTVVQTPAVNLPYVGKLWAIVTQPPVVSQGTVGPWINPYTNMAGIPCERTANRNVDKPNPAIAASGCQNQSYGIGGGISGGIFTYDTNQALNCQFNGSVNENSYTITSTPVWFYDNPYVCHVLDVQYPPTGGTNNDSFEKHILGIYWQQSGYPRTVEATMTGAWKVSAPATATNNPFCNSPPVSTFSRNPFCATLTVPVGTADVSAIANGLASGQRFRACINIDNPNTTSGGGGYSYGCYVFPQGTPNVTPVAAAGGTLTPQSVQIMVYYAASTTPNVNVYSYPAGTKTVTISSTCPTSGNCSISVPAPAQITNAVGYDVYARAGGTGLYYRQNTTGPVPINASAPFVFGTTTQPFVTSATSGAYPMPIGPSFGSTFNAFIANVVAADTVNHTLTIDAQQGPQPLPSPSNNATIFVMRQLTGIPADATSTTSSIVCASCDFTPWDSWKGVPNYAVVYCGVTPGDLGPFPNYALYSFAPNRGSTIQKVDAVNHTLTLTTAINCGPGINFEVRQPGGLAGNNRIFLWTKGSYDVWKRLGNWMGADAVMWLAQDTIPVGFPNSAPNPGASYIVSRRRESALSVMSCSSAIHVLNDLSTLGMSTALSPSTTCQSPATGSNRVRQLFATIDTMSNGNQGRGATIGSFLDGLLLDAIINWWLDPLMNVQADPSYLYWSKRLTDILWNTYYGARTSPVSACPPLYPHEYSYDMESNLLGVCYSNSSNWWPSGSGVGSPAPVADYWSIYGNIMPAFAFFYQRTGNATIPNSNPPTTYGAAYMDMASWAFVHMSSMFGFVAGGPGMKTLGEMGIWQDQALTWMKGNGGTSPTTLTIITNSLPTATVGTAYSANVTASGGTPPYTWTSSRLPDGLSMNTSGGISGVPLTAGTTATTFTVTDSASATASTNLNLTVNGPAAPPSYPAYMTGVIP